MKRQLSMVFGILTSALFFGGVSYASVGIEQIQASFHNIQLLVNGKTITTSAKPFIYQNNVYAPIYSVGHALGAQVAWVNSTPKVVVTGSTSSSQSDVKPLSVWINGRQMPDGSINGNGSLLVPAGNSAYITATGLTPTVDAAGNLNLSQVSPASLSGTLLTSLTPSGMSGDFSNTSLYPGGTLTGFYAPTVLGKLYSGQSTIEWGVNAGHSSVIPQLSYALPSQAQTFSGAFAIDDLTRNFGGSAQVVFVGDGKTIGSTGWVQGGSAPVPFTISVAGVQTLQIQYEIKGPHGTVYSSGQTYQAPTVNADGVNGPMVFTDLLQPTLSGMGSANVTVSTSNSG